MSGSFATMLTLAKLHKFKIYKQIQLKIRFICLFSQCFCGKKKGRERKQAS